MEDHMAGHNKEKYYECDVCGKAWQHPYQLETHRHVHTGERPFDCSECGKNLTRYETLPRYNRMHSGDTPFGCSYCVKSFSHSHSLLVHRHTHSLTFAQYGKGFTHSPKLLSHQQVHTSDRPFTRPFGCSDCGKDLKAAYDVMAHWRVTRARSTLAAPPVARNFQFIEAAGALAVWKKK